MPRVRTAGLASPSARSPCSRERRAGPGRGTPGRGRPVRARCVRRAGDRTGRDRRPDRPGTPSPSVRGSPAGRPGRSAGAGSASLRTTPVRRATARPSAELARRLPARLPADRGSIGGPGWSDWRLSRPDPGRVSGYAGSIVHRPGRDGRAPPPVGRRPAPARCLPDGPRRRQPPRDPSRGRGRPAAGGQAGPADRPGPRGLAGRHHAVRAAGLAIGRLPRPADRC